MRKKIICGNWKMNTLKNEAIALVSAIEKDMPDTQNEVVVCPPFPYLEAVKNTVSKLKIGAQDCFYENKGAYTGEVSPEQIKEYTDYVILGHSERRNYQKEDDEIITKKVKSALLNGLIPIVCVGETKEQRDKGQEKEIVKNQTRAVINNLDQNEISKLIFAYEPVWAIGTGDVCDVSSAKEIVKVIRETIDEKFSISNEISVLYGGSVTGDNVKEFSKEEKIDGALVGGASLKPQEFLEIIKLFN